MIIDRMENYRLYPFGSAWEKAFEFLQTLSVDSPDQKYLIEGEDIFAIVMSYETQVPENGVFESHEKYVDIQTVIEGAERFECAFREDLPIKNAYDPVKEAAFYHRTQPAPIAVDVRSGTFVMLYPQDAHLAGLIVGSVQEKVKKVVVKIKRALLEV